MLSLVTSPLIIGMISKYRVPGQDALIAIDDI